MMTLDDARPLAGQGPERRALRMLYGTVSGSSPLAVVLDGDAGAVPAIAACDAPAPGERVVMLLQSGILVAVAVVGGTTPAGAVVFFARATAPAGWLVCDGSAVSRSDYSRLFAAIETTFGSGDGSTTFNVPDIKGRVVAGRSAGDASFDTLGETGGAKTHTLSTSEIPSHSHGITDRTATPTPGSGMTVYATRVGAATESTAVAGGGGAHNNLQPYIVLLPCIKT